MGTLQLFETPDIGRISEADEAAFERHCADLANRQGRLLTMLVLFVALAFWPIDRVLMAESPALLRASETWRLGVLCIGPAALLGLHVTRGRLLTTLIVATLAGAAAAGVAALAYGRASDTWFPYFFITPFATVHLTIRPGPRVVITAFACAVVTAVFHLVAPVTAPLAEIGLRVSFMTFCWATACFLGHVGYLLARTNFFQARLLEQRVADKTVELRELLDHLSRARESERGYIGRELHDEMGSLFAAMRFQVDRIASSQAASAADLSELNTLIQTALDSTRAIVADLRPRALDELGFASAVEEQCNGFEARTGVGCMWSIEPPDLQVPAERGLAAMRVLQESLTNVARHAAATCVEVRIEAVDGVLELTIIDDGRGVHPGGRRGFGLLGMRERAAAFGGRFEVGPAPGRGTRVHAQIPLAAPTTASLGPRLAETEEGQDAPTITPAHPAAENGS